MCRYVCRPVFYGSHTLLSVCLTRLYAQTLILAKSLLVKLFSSFVIMLNVANLQPSSLTELFLCFSSTFLYLPGPVTKALDLSFLAPKFSRTKIIDLANPFGGSYLALSIPFKGPVATTQWPVSGEVSQVGFDPRRGSGWAAHFWCIRILQGNGRNSNVVLYSIV